MSGYELSAPVAIDRYFELRLYQMVPSRMPDFHDLLGVQVPSIFEHNGIARPLGFWESHAGRLAPLFAYIIPWTNLDARMENWKRFYADPEWKEKLAANYAGEQRVERSDILILRPSPVWQRLKEPASDVEIGGVHELCFHDILNQDPAKAHDALAEIDLPFLKARGARILGVFSTWFGARMNQAVTILAWPDSATMQSAYREQIFDKAIIEARDAERARFGRPLFRGVDRHIMTPIPYGVPKANLGTEPRA